MDLPGLLLLLGPALVLAQVRHPVPVLWMMPVSSGPGGDNLTASVAPAVRLALQDLQRQPPPLGSYEVQLQLLDSQCDPAKALKALFDAMWAGPKYLLVFGGVCPAVTAVVARALPALGLVQVSFAASSPGLANRRLYGNLFSTVPSDRVLNQAAVKLLQRYRWSRVGVVTQEGARLSEMKTDLLRQLLKAGVQVLSTQTLEDGRDACSSLRRLKESDVRIIVAHFEEDRASEVFCCAYRLQLFGARYQWILGGAAGWGLGGRLHGCTADSLLAAADGSIRLQTRRLSGSNAAGVSGRTPQDYQDHYLRQVDQEGSKVSPLHAFAYDAVWVAASAVSQAMEAVKNRDKFNRRPNASVNEDDVHGMLLDAMKTTQLEGVTGPVVFRGGERTTSIELIQFQGVSGVSVGLFSSSSHQLRLVTHLLQFKGPGPARDRAQVLRLRRHVSLRQYAIVSSAAAVTVVLTLTALVLTVLTRLTRSSGGSQDEVLLLGVLLSSSSVLMSGLDGLPLSPWTLQLLCSVRLWILSVGHTVGVAELLSRTWRLYSLKRRRRPQPAGRVLVWMVLVDVLVLSSWQTLDPLRWVALQHSSEGDVDVVVRPFSERCSSVHTPLWLSALCGYKGPLLALGCLLACSVMAAPAPPGSRPLALTVFAVSALSAAGVPASLLTSHNPALQFCVSSVLILCCGAFTLSFLFGPKLLCLSGEELPGDAAEEEEEEEGEEPGEEPLRRLNLQLRGQSSQLDEEMEAISSQLRETAARGGEVARVWSQDRKSSPDGINAPEHVWRRRSVTLPILHHAYLPAGGGVSASSSSLFGSREAFLHHGLLTTTSCPPDGARPGATAC